jgi:CubicO group peptidase (beta-lactamase class C family)
VYGFDGRTIFEIGSVSKIFTALLLADMVEKGEVTLDDPAEKFLPRGVKMPAGGGDKITLRDLATHRSGLPRLPDNMPATDGDDPYANYSEAKLFEFLGHYKLTRAVGGRYEYSNVGMGLLGYLLARRSGRDYGALVRARITGPLGMKDTVVELSSDQKTRFATGHDGAMRPTKPWNMAILAGAGGLHSTANDILLLLDALTGRRSTELRSAMALMLENRWPAADPRQETGLGWLTIKGSKGEIAWHDGATGGYTATLAWDQTRRRGAIVLTNMAVEPSTDEIAFNILDGTRVTVGRPKVPAP